MATGRVIKGVGGFYYVSDGEQVYMGNARGILKRNKDLLYVGDLVDYDLREDGDCIITRVHERANVLERPPVSNLEVLVIVFAAASPEINHMAVNKMTIHAESLGIEVLFCMTKGDLAEPSARESLAACYGSIYPLLEINNLTGEGVPALREKIRGKRTALAGASGVGKSTLLNHLTGGLSAEIGEISDRTGRGKHTTRHVEIFRLSDGTEIYDTPGFTALDLPKMEAADLKGFFREFREHNPQCYYSDCMHLKEPGCAVKEAVSSGEIPSVRYDAYLAMLEEVKKQWRR